MSLIITLSDELAEGLKPQADDSQMTIEEFAVRALEKVAAGQSSSIEPWNKINSRRVDLI